MKKNQLLPREASMASNCINLRPGLCRGIESLVPAVPPAIIAEGAWRVIGVFQGPDGRVVELMVNGTDLGASVHSVDEEAPEPYLVANFIDGDVNCCYQVDNGFMLMTTKCCYRVVYDESYMLRVETRVEPEELPVLTSMVISESVVGSEIGGFKLSGSYNTSTSLLAPDDAAKLNKHVAEAYRQASVVAVSSGGFVAPVFVRYRYFDRDNRLLFESAPKLHVPTGRHDYTAITTLAVDSSGNRVESGSLSLAYFKLGLSIPASDNSIASMRVARLEVQMTPQIHRADLSLPVSHHLSFKAGGSLSLSLPGCGNNDSGAAALERRLGDAIAGIDGLFQTVTTIYDPFKAGGVSHVVNIGSRQLTVDQETSLLAKVCGKDEVEDECAACCRLPHIVTSLTAIKQGELTLMGNMTVGKYKGEPAAYFANNGMAGDSVSTVAVVKFRDGRQVSRCFEWKSGYREVAFSPVLCYPDPEAVSITLTTVDSSGAVLSGTYRLTPRGRFACYIDPAVEPMELPEAKTSLVELTDERPVVRFPGSVICFNGMSPGSDIEVLKVGDGALKVIHPISRPSTSAWESSRSRFLLMGDDGIFSLAMSGGKPVPPVFLDGRPVAGRESVATVTVEGDTPAVYIVAGRDIVTSSGNRIMTLINNVDVDKLVWIGRYGELWAIKDADSGSRALVYHLAYGGWSQRQLPLLSSVYSDLKSPRATSIEENKLYDLSRDVANGVTRCCYTAIIPQPADVHPLTGVPRVNAIVVDLTAGSVDGTITVSGDHGREPQRVFSRLIINGEVNRALCHHLLMPPRYHTVVTLDGMLSADAELRSINNL